MALSEQEGRLGVFSPSRDLGVLGTKLGSYCSQLAPFPHPLCPPSFILAPFFVLKMSS